MSLENKIEIIERDIKKLKVINIIFILIAIGLNVYALLYVDTILITNKISFAAAIVALIFGLVYAFKDYQKEAVKTFNLFINLCIVMLLLQSVGEIYSCYAGYQGVKSTIISCFSIAIEVLILAILECVKNMGKKAAIALGCTVLGFAIFGFLRNITLIGDPDTLKIYLIISFAGIVLACVICLFIIAKYSNKNLRSTQEQIK